jgi:hypothetical protein
LLGLKEALEIASPVAVTLAEDCRAHPSRKGSVRAGAGWKLGWAAAKVSEKSGIRSLNIFIKYPRRRNAPPLSNSHYVHSIFINSIQ